jgi:hypothetical protein
VILKFLLETCGLIMCNIKRCRPTNQKQQILILKKLSSFMHSCLGDVVYMTAMKPQKSSAEF